MRPPRHLFFVLVGVLAASSVAVVGGVAAAADGPRSRAAAIDFSQVDDDFAFQGEYYGPLATAAESAASIIGLQVVARGGGEFIAVEYPGGLPGYGWFGGEKTPLKGRRETGRVSLSGSDRHYVVVANGAAQSVDDRGNVLGSIVKVHRISRTMGQAPPKDAIVLFDGRQTDRLANARVTADGLLKEGTVTKEAYPDYLLHAEFQLSYMPYAREQGRSNSGIYLQRRYEVQILDSFGLDGAFNECGAIYRFRKPDINMCLPPLNWQTYDIDFHSPRFDADGKKFENGRLTVLQNGYPVQDNVELLNKTGHGEPETPKALPILLQQHGNPVRFRNMWLVVHSPLPPSGSAPTAPENSSGAGASPCVGCSVEVSPSPPQCDSCSW
jgi:hypothetical protein